MWFKHINIFEVSGDFDRSLDRLVEQLSSLSFKPCPKSLPMSRGWVPPIGDDDALLIHSHQQYMMCCLRYEEKLLPPSVVREQLKIKLKEIELATGRKVYKDEKERLKDDIYQTLLTRALTKSTHVYGYFDFAKNWLVIDTASSKRCAQFISMLIKSCPGISIAPYATQSIPSLLTDWLRHNTYPKTLCIEDACVIKILGDMGSVIRFKNQDLLNNEVRIFVEKGGVVTQMTLSWCDKIRFTLKEDFSIGGMKFFNSVKELTKDGLSETPEERFSSDFFIMAETLQPFIQELLDAFKEDASEQTIPPPVLSVVG